MTGMNSGLPGWHACWERVWRGGVGYRGPVHGEREGERGARDGGRGDRWREGEGGWMAGGRNRGE